MQPFEQIVRAYGPMVLRVCRAVLGPDEAEDAASETFLAALRAYPQLDGAANVEAWLVTIAHRKAIDAARAASRRARPTEPVPETAIAEAAIPEAGSRATASPVPMTGTAPEGPAAELWQALAALPGKQRVVLAYRYLADLPYAEIAGIVGGSTAAARRAAADGVATLRRTYPSAAASGGGAAGETTAGDATAGDATAGAATAHQATARRSKAKGEPR